MPIRHLGVLRLILCALLFLLQVREMEAGGVTIITHGLSGNIDTWASAMASRIAQHPHLGSSHCIYALNVTDHLGGTVTAQKLAGSDFFDTQSGELIIALDWRTLAAIGSSWDTYDVAAVVAPYLLHPQFLPELSGHAIAELPIHLVGHSRGGSLVCELSWQLGRKGIWVDHVTTLDPHPINNDGFFDPKLFWITDAPLRTYESVLFHDNYYQELNVYAYGKAVAGAFIRKLTNLDGGYTALLSSHSDVHLWYHGTVDLSTPASNSDVWLTDAERRTWYTNEEQFGARAGFHYSLIGRGNRLSNERPAGGTTSRIVDGFNGWWDFGAGVVNNRRALGQNTFEWPSLIRFNLNGTGLVAHGDTPSATVYLQKSRVPVSPSAPQSVAILIDEDLNPWNGNERVAAEYPLSVDAANQISFGSLNFNVTPAVATPGARAVFARLDGGGKSRVLYASEFLTVFSTFAAPSLSVTHPNFRTVQITGQIGQRIVVEASEDLAGWTPIATNWLEATTWQFTDQQQTRSRFYRAAVR